MERTHDLDATSSISRQDLFSEPGGKRDLGRPRKRWRNQLISPQFFSFLLPVRLHTTEGLVFPFVAYGFYCPFDFVIPYQCLINAFYQTNKENSLEHVPPELFYEDTENYCTFPHKRLLYTE
jgi:hypothetical protein